jgi:hypothetical protein
LETADLRVTKQLQRVDGKLQLVAPKTARSRRMLAVPASTARSLRRHRDRQLQEKAEGRQKMGRERICRPLTMAECQALCAAGTTRTLRASTAPW